MLASRQCQRRRIFFPISLYYGTATAVPHQLSTSHRPRGHHGWKKWKIAQATRKQQQPLTNLSKAYLSGCHNCSLVTAPWYVILSLTLRTLFTALLSLLSAPSSWWSSFFLWAFMYSSKYRKSIPVGWTKSSTVFKPGAQDGGKKANTQLTNSANIVYTLGRTQGVVLL